MESNNPVNTSYVHDKIFNAICDNDMTEFTKLCKTNINTRESKYGGTPLHFTSGQGKVDMTNMLLDKGAKVDALDNFGNTPLLLAACAGHIVITNSIKYFIMHIRSINWIIGFHYFFS